MSHKGTDGGTTMMSRLSLFLSKEGYGDHRCSLALGLDYIIDIKEKKRKLENR